MPIRTSHRPGPKLLTFSEGWARALRLMGQRAYAQAEIDARLARAGCQAACRQAIIARLLELGILDDRRLAEQVASSEAARGRGPRAVRARLRSRGLDPAAAPHEDQPLALARAEELLRRRVPHITGPKDKARALRFLANRGFDSQTCRQLLARLPT